MARKKTKDLDIDITVDNDLTITLDKLEYLKKELHIVELEAQIHSMLLVDRREQIPIKRKLVEEEIARRDSLREKIEA